MELRPYQQAAVDAVYEHLRGKETNPCIVLPTGTGKSVVIAKIVRDAVMNWNGRVLSLAHVKELLEQNAAKIRLLCPDIPVGIFSAGLKSRDTRENVIVAGIQSVHDKACELGAFDLIVIDEAHLIAPDGDGMYRTFLNDMKVVNPNVRLIGLTATPYRLKGGLICQPENLLNEVCYEAGLKEMILQGYLAPLTSKAGRAAAKLDELHIRGGEFINDEIAAAMDTEELVAAACREIAELTRDRKSVLVFTTSVEHCRHVAEKLAAYSGMECGIVTGDTPQGERAELIARFKGELVPDDFFSFKKPLKFLANVNVLTTGFDAPNTDCVVLLRPTNSAGLLVQMAGRGTRLSPETGKTDCLLLDYGENILRHGPLDMIAVRDKTPGGGEAPAKTCPDCQSVIHAAYRSCPDCGYEFPEPTSNLSQSASTAGVLSGQTAYTDYDVAEVFYAVHEKRYADPDTPKTVRVDYRIGFNEFKSEWICPEHTGYARDKFVKWWRERAALGAPLPSTAREAVALAQQGALAEPKSITVKTVAGEKFDRITGWWLKPRPDYVQNEDWQSDDFDDDEIPF